MKAGDVYRIYKYAGLDVVGIVISADANYIEGYETTTGSASKQLLSFSLATHAISDCILQRDVMEVPLSAEQALVVRIESKIDDCINLVDSVLAKEIA